MSAAPSFPAKPKRFPWAAPACSALACLAPGLATAAQSSQDAFSALAGAGPWTSAGGFFLAGALLSLTPCSLPMAPIIARVVCGPEGSPGSRLRAALSFGLGLSLCYAAAGACAALAGAGLSAAARSPAALLGFSALLFALGLSSLGLFQIKTPAWIDRLSGAGFSRLGSPGRLAPAFAMGALTSLVAGPCVAPALAGALAFIAETGEAGSGAASLFFLAWGMILPMLALSAGLGSLLPKAGAWMIWAQRVLGAALILASLHFAAPAFGLPSPLGWALGSEEAPSSSASSIGSKASDFEPVAGIEAFEAIARGERRPIVVSLHAAWCVACDELRAKSFPDPRVQKLFGQARLLSVDATSMDAGSQAFMKKYGLFGPPALLAFAPGSGKPERAVGFMEPGRLAAILEPAFAKAARPVPAAQSTSWAAKP